MIILLPGPACRVPVPVRTFEIAVDHHTIFALERLRVVGESLADIMGRALEEWADAEIEHRIDMDPDRYLTPRPPPVRF